MNDVLFTPAALLDLLMQIDELNGYNINVSESIDGDMQICIGDSVYSIDTDNAVNVSVDDSVIDTVEDENLTAYRELEESGSVEVTEPIESGILKSAVKSLLVGGMIRLASKLLK